MSWISLPSRRNANFSPHYVSWSRTHTHTKMQRRPLTNRTHRSKTTNQLYQIPLNKKEPADLKAFYYSSLVSQKFFIIFTRYLTMGCSLGCRRPRGNITLTTALMLDKQAFLFCEMTISNRREEASPSGWSLCSWRSRLTWCFPLWRARPLEAKTTADEFTLTADVL